MAIPFLSQDLDAMFDARGLTRGISLVLTGAVEVRFQDERIAADTAEKRMAALASMTFGEDGAALPATEAEEIAFLFGPAPDQMAA